MRPAKIRRCCGGGMPEAVWTLSLRAPMVEVGLSPSRECSWPCVSRMRMGYWNWAGLVLVLVVEEGGGGTGEEEEEVEVEAGLGEEGATVAVGMARGGTTAAVRWMWKRWGGGE